MEMKYGAAIKLKDFKMDFDDVIRNVFGKRTDIEGNIYLGLVVLPEVKKETKDEKKGENNANSGTSK